MKVLISPDAESLGRAAADMFVAFAAEYIEEKERFVAAVSGGSTPIKLFSLLASGDYRDRIDWRYVHFFLADERFVPADHEDSNYRVLNENLLSKIPIPSENLHAVRTDVSSVSLAAALYEDDIRSFFGISGYTLPQFDLILLGIGEDGHTASLFPGSDALAERDRLAISVIDQTHEHPRVTLSLPVINNAENVIFLISGEQKALITKRVLEERDDTLPASLVRPENGHRYFMLDKKAGSMLLELPE